MRGFQPARARRWVGAAGAATPTLIAALALLAAPAPSAAQTDCAAAMSTACTERLGAGALAPADDSCQKQWAAYRACLGRLATEGARPAPGPAAGCTEAQAQRLWTSAERAGDCFAYQGYRAACPNTPEARFAELAMRRLRCAADPAPVPVGSTTISAPAATSEEPAQPAWTPSETLIRAAQTELRRLRLYRGAVDGLWGGGSARALSAFERAEGLAPADGRLKESTLAALRAAPTPSRPPRPAAPPDDEGSAAYFAAVIGDQVLFGPGSSDLTLDARGILDRQAAWFQRHPQSRLVIEGYAAADEAGLTTREELSALSARRADGVRGYLKSKGVDRNRIGLLSMGGARPAEECGPGDLPCQAKNRRVVVVAEPRR